MTFELEQELKVMLNKKQFDELLTFWHLDRLQPSVKQHNTYYDSPDEKLKATNAALRLRNFEHSSVWTIKHRQNNFQSHEYHQENSQPISPPVTLSQHSIHETTLLTFLFEHAIDLNELNQTYDIQTQRWLVNAEFGEFALDLSHYGDIVDYELELETEQLENAQIAFKSFLANFKIEMNQADTKLSRAASYLNQKD